MKTFAAVLVYLLWIFNLIDYFTTDILLQHGYEEANPVMAWVIDTHGILGCMAFKLIFLLILTEILFLYYEEKLIPMAKVYFFIGTIFLSIIYIPTIIRNLILYAEIAIPYFT